MQAVFPLHAYTTLASIGVQRTNCRDRVWCSVWPLCAHKRDIAVPGIGAGRVALGAEAATPAMRRTAIAGAAGAVALGNWSSGRLLMWYRGAAHRGSKFELWWRGTRRRGTGAADGRDCKAKTWGSPTTGASAGDGWPEEGCGGWRHCGNRGWSLLELRCLKTWVGPGGSIVAALTLVFGHGNLLMADAFALSRLKL